METAAEKLKRMEEEFLLVREGLERQAAEEATREEEKRRFKLAEERRLAEEKRQAEELAARERDEDNDVPIKSEFAVEVSLRRGSDRDLLRERMAGFQEVAGRAMRVLDEGKLVIFLEQATRKMSEDIDGLLECLDVDSDAGSGSEYRDDGPASSRGKRSGRSVRGRAVVGMMNDEVGVCCR